MRNLGSWVTTSERGGTTLVKGARTKKAFAYRRKKKETLRGKKESHSPLSD